MGDVTLKVPTEHATRFHENVLYRWESAADAVSSMFKYARERKRSWDEAAIDRARLDQVGRLLDEVGVEHDGGEIIATASPEVLRSILHGMLVDLADELHRDCESAVFPFDVVERHIGQLTWIGANLRELGEPVEPKLEAVES